MRPTVTVLICTRNRAESLRLTLASLAADTSCVPAEVLVVDNGSTDHTAAVLRSARGETTRPIVLRTEATPGLSPARNAGIRAAIGDWIVFTDDDVTVLPGWLDALARRFEPGVSGVGGRIVPRFLGERPPWLGSDNTHLTLLDYGEAPFEMGLNALPIGANMAIRAEVLRAMLPEPFDVTLGHRGAVALSHAETFLLWKLASARHRLVYAPDAVVEHRISPGRTSYGAVRRRVFQAGVGAGRFERLSGELPALHTRLIRAARTIRWACARRVANSRRGEVDAAAAEEEFTAYGAAARHIEEVLWRYPRFVELLARHVT
ncbi:MAG TPA: glycosyltransferase family 2 protein [Solirubrobacteraceae bacterium]|jgi:glycosyltransferase involved in cell wall biosynthesis|nr:glycosyltransferase family 2 protein [Solirubrobacteraceae bacterium]